MEQVYITYRHLWRDYCILFAIVSSRTANILHNRWQLNCSRKNNLISDESYRNEKYGQP